MESNWRFNVAKLGLAFSGVELIARLLDSTDYQLISRQDTTVGGTWYLGFWHWSGIYTSLPTLAFLFPIAPGTHFPTSFYQVEAD